MQHRWLTQDARFRHEDDSRTKKGQLMTTMAMTMLVVVVVVVAPAHYRCRVLHG